MTDHTEKTPRERVIRLIAEMRNHTVERGATPAEAAAFAAKVQALIEKYQIDEAELKRESGIRDPTDIEVTQNKLATGKRVFNPGMTAVVSGLAQGMCCKVILLHEVVSGHSIPWTQAVYGIVGDELERRTAAQAVTFLAVPLKDRRDVPRERGIGRRADAAEQCSADDEEPDQREQPPHHHRPARLSTP